jgi:WD40 repeat protein
MCRWQVSPLETWEEQAEIQAHPQEIWGIAVAPNGQVLATGSADRKIKLWDLESHDLLGVLDGYLGIVMALAFSPDSSLLAAGITNGELKVWDVAGRSLKSNLIGHQHNVTCLAFSRDGKTLASGSPDCTVRFWDTASGKLRATLEGNMGPVYSLALSPEGFTLAAGTGDREQRSTPGQIVLWDLRTGQVRATLGGHKSVVSALAYSHDGRYLAAAGWDHSARIYNTATNQVIGNTTYPYAIWSLQFAPKAKMLTICGEGQEIFSWCFDELAKPRLLTTTAGSPVWSALFLPDGHSAITANGKGVVTLWHRVKDPIPPVFSLVFYVGVLGAWCYKSWPSAGGRTCRTTNPSIRLAAPVPDKPQAA